jgi:23S rRNA (cytosine1962-C5)-methyltransferase
MNSILRLKPHEDRRIKSGHLWIYSNEIDVKATPFKNFQIGQLVQLESARSEFLGVGYINPNNLLCCKLLTRQKTPIDVQFLVQRIQNALALRNNIFTNPYYRLIFAESDFLPGLVVDRYGDVLVAQITAAGMENLKDIVVEALKDVIKPRAILWRNDSSTTRELEGLPKYVAAAFGDPPEKVFLEENKVQFTAPIFTGQKTGWFYDHRDNRARLQRYVMNKRMLDIFSYIGAWGVQAAVFGASEVLCVDSSESAISDIADNAKKNQVEKIVTTQKADAFEFLKHNKQKFDVIIIDPPAFIKKRKDLESGLIAYQRINEYAMQSLNAKGILITSSCSLHLSEEKFIDVLRRAALKTRRQLQILERGHQAPDHPIHPAIPETAYLKALFCQIN